MPDERTRHPWMACERDHFALAFERMERILPEDPENADLLWRAGSISRFLHRFEEAEDRFGAALRLERDPSHRASILTLRADARSRLWRLDAAEADLREALRLDPADLGARVDLGNLHLRAGREGPAEDAFRQAAQSDRPEHAAEAHLALARLLRAQRRFREAVFQRQQEVPRLPAIGEVHDLPAGQAHGARKWRRDRG